MTPSIIKADSNKLMSVTVEMVLLNSHKKEWARTSTGIGNISAQVLFQYWQNCTLKINCVMLQHQHPVMASTISSLKDPFGISLS